MKHNRLRSMLWAAAVIAALLMAGPPASAQEPDTSGVIWWVIGAGSCLDGVSGGDSLSATLGQLAVDSAGIDDASYGKLNGVVDRSSFTARLGFWLPRGTDTDAPPPTATPMSLDAIAISIRPNPFRSHATVEYLLDEEGFVRLSVYSQDCRAVRALVAARQRTGMHVVEWDGRDDAGQVLSSGAYVYCLELTPQSGGAPKLSTGTIQRVK